MVKTIRLGKVHRINVDEDANTWKLQWYDSDAAVWKDIMSYSSNNQAIAVNPIIFKDAPLVDLKGTETDAKEISVKESAGKLIFRDEGAAVDRTIWSGDTGRRLKPLIDSSELAAEVSGGGAAAPHSDGSDGDITETDNITRYGFLYPVHYDDGGYIVTSGYEVLGIIATHSIKISGKIDALGKGASGGDGGAGAHGDNLNGSSGASVSSGLFLGIAGNGGAGSTDTTVPGKAGAIGAGGGGGTRSNGVGGSGGDAPAALSPSYIHFFPNNAYDKAMARSNSCGTGGAGGGGGGQGALNRYPGHGGHGGASGGLVILCAPKVSISGEIDVRGEAGVAGADAEDVYSGGGGGGAGGSGGTILIITPNLEETTPTYSIAGGAKGAGGLAQGGGSDGGDGGAGADGKVIKLISA